MWRLMRTDNTRTNDNVVLCKQFWVSWAHIFWIRFMQVALTLTVTMPGLLVSVVFNLTRPGVECRMLAALTNTLKYFSSPASLNV